MIGIFSKGIAAIPHLDAFLGESVAYRPTLPDPAIGAIAGWGAKPTARQARLAAQRHGLPYLSLEDGFLRSLGLGASRPVSLIADHCGIYYDATGPSDLENLLNRRGWEDAGLLSRAVSVRKTLVELGLSKYNHAPEAPDELFRGSAKKVLIVDQTRGDISVERGMASADSFHRMLDAARHENPDADLFVKIHPEVFAGRKKGYLEKIPLDYEADIIGQDYAPFSILDKIDKVYVVSSQLGFEALVMGKEVCCFGAPFYAGWGVTQDRIACPRRQESRSVEEILAAAYLLYPRYVDPFSGRECAVERAVEILADLRLHNETWRGVSVCLGFSKWKRPHARAFLSGGHGGKVVFDDNPARAVKKARAAGGRLVVWASKERKGLEEAAGTEGVKLIRMEDGFLRSVGLGSDFHTPFSLILDGEGIHYDPSRPSALESMIEKGRFDEPMLARARKLRERIVDSGITKYNTGSSQADSLSFPANQKIILVPGQVETDASIRLGSPEITTNLSLLEKVRESSPDAFIIYKSHPDVVAGNRTGRIRSQAAEELSDLVINGISMGSLIPLVHEVHTLTSLAGFEALLRGKKVHTYGGPFYAGWGLTVDRLSFPRRTRRATLDELTAAALILYPTYYDWKTLMYCSPETVLDRLCTDAGTRAPERGFLRRHFRRLMRLLIS